MHGNGGGVLRAFVTLLLLAAVATPTPAAEPDPLRYGYYPGRQSLEVEATLPGSAAARGDLPLDAVGKGRGMIPLPDLPDGTYRVEYGVDGAMQPARLPFVREHFPFEQERLGLTHEVFAPFTPVRVSGATVSVVGRRYAINPFGFAQAESLGRPLLAAPIRLVGETASGAIAWRDERIAVASKHDDEATRSFHFIGDNSMRFNYAGPLPRGRAN
jgi:hypothetical protein